MSKPAPKGVRIGGLVPSLTCHVAPVSEIWPCCDKSRRFQPAATFGRTGPAPSLGNTIESTLLARVWVNQPPNCEHGRVVPITHLPYGGRGQGEMPSPCPLISMAYKITGLEATRAEELSLPPTSFNTQESGLCTS